MSNQPTYPPHGNGKQSHPQLPSYPSLGHYRSDSKPMHIPQFNNGDYEDRRGSASALVMSPEEDVDDFDPPSPIVDIGKPKKDKKDKGKDGEKERKPVATRRRVVQSCSECRRRKIKCDKKFPCGIYSLICVRGVGLTSQDLAYFGTIRRDVMRLEPAPAVPGSASAAELAAVVHRLDALESALAKSGALMPGDLDLFLRTNREDSATDAGPSRRESIYVENLPRTEDGVSDMEGAALTLEHLAFGRSKMEGSHAIPHFGARIHSTLARNAPNNSYHLAKTSGVHSSGHSPASASPNHDGNRSSPALIKRSSLHDGPKNFAESMSPSERTARIDALLDMIGPTDMFDLFWKQTEVGNRSLLKVLPSAERGELLVRTYLEKVDWLHRCLHVPTFLSQCQDLWALTPERIMQEISMPFIALYFIVCCLGLHFMECSEVLKHFTEEEAHTLPDVYYNAARAAQWGSDFLGSHSIESVQVLILIGVFLNNKDRADAAWALLGAAIKMAQGLGLSHLGSEQQVVDGKPLPMWTGRWASLIQREVGRRLWWNLVYLDWALAPNYNYACSIQLDQIKTGLPANIEDIDIVDGQPLVPQPANVRTCMSFQLAKFKFAEISQRQIWQANNNSHPPYSFVLGVDGQLRKAMMELPAFMQPDPNERGPKSRDPRDLVAHYEKVTLSLGVHFRMLRLHRPWLSRGHEDERFAYSADQCIRAARASLRIMSNDNETAAFLEKWWIPLFYVTVSAMVVIIDLLRTARRDMHSPETQEKIIEVYDALTQMRGIADISHPARAAIKVMDFLMGTSLRNPETITDLLAEIEDRRKPSGSSLGKRKATGEPSEDGEEHGLQRAVKKLIQQAQLEADSPSSGSHGTPNRSTTNSIPKSSPTGRADKSPPANDSSAQRGVFDAYPHPPNTETTDTYPPTAYATAQPPYGAPGPAQSPYTSFPPDNSAAYPMFDSSMFMMPQPQQQQPLDPDIESMLASYFPPNQVNQSQGIAGSAAAPSAPDDFLSKVFSFSWENQNQNQNQNQQNQAQNQFQQLQHQGRGQTQLPDSHDRRTSLPLHPAQIQQQNILPGAGQIPQQNSPFPGGQQPGYGFDNWSSHGWMA